jgi:anti-anti-sigma factor
VLHTSRPVPDDRRLVGDLAAVPDLAVLTEIAPDPTGPPPPGAEPPTDLLDGLLGEDEDTLSLVLDGAVDSALEAELAEVLESVRNSRVRHIVLELATVTAMDGTGLRFISAVRSLAVERGGTVRVADPTEAVVELLESSGAAATLGVLDAPASVGGGPGTSTEGWPGARPA